MTFDQILGICLILCAYGLLLYCVIHASIKIEEIANSHAETVRGLKEDLKEEASDE